MQSCRLPIQPIAFLTFSLSSHPWNLGARSIQPKFRPVRPGKEDHLKRWTIFFETFPVGPNRSIEFWTEISGNFGRDPFDQNSNWSDREKWSTSKGGPVFSKLFRLDRTDPLSFGPKFPEILVEWLAPIKVSN